MCSGGETGIRTLGTREGSTVFETAPFDHSGTSPRRVTGGDVGQGFGRRNPFSLGENLRFDRLGAWIAHGARLPRAQNFDGAKRDMVRFLAAFGLVGWFAGAAMAQSVAPIDTLYRAMGLPDLMQIMREEGVNYGLEMEADLLAGQGDARWAAMVEDVYDLALMEETVRNRLDSELAAEDLEPMIRFFSSELGERIVLLEVSARRAMMDDSVDEASRAMLAMMKDDAAPRLEALGEFARTNDLINNNVVGALNSNYAFYSGLADGGALPADMSDDEILADVWEQEEFIRVDTEEWVFAYMAMAYQPLSDAELKAYIDFSATAEGLALNQALFAAFDELFVGISLALGRGASGFLAGQEL